MPQTSGHGVGERALRIAVLADGFIGWTGGAGFLRLILRGLDSQAGATRVHLLHSGVASGRPVAQCITQPISALVRAARWSRGTVPGETRLEELFAGVADGATILSYDQGVHGLRLALADIGADVVLPSFTSLGRHFPVPWVGYLYDFQHRHLPQLFSRTERLRRDIAFRRILRNAPVVLANSTAVRSDVALFYRGFERKVITLPFAPAVQPEWLDVGESCVRVKYGLPPRYFAISNQFWIHKDHATAIRALRMLHEATGMRDIGLVCTGSQEDYRAPGHFASIQALIKDLGLDSSVRLLGLVPKQEQMAIVRAALAVVQPTLFEGGPGGGAGYDAVAVGTPLIASDIPVNREIDLGDVRYFSRSDPASLAMTMSGAVEPAIRPSTAELLGRSHDRIAMIGSRLVEAANRALEISRRDRAQ